MSPPPLPKVVFFGSDAIALPLLEHLRSGSGRHWELAGVVSQPDRPKGRGKKLQANPVAAFARQHGLPLHAPERPGPELTAWLHGEGVALGLVMAYGHILGRALLEAPGHGCLNLHASLLPRYRGASPIETAIAGGETETGVTLMRMVRQMDAGDIADAERVAIEPGETAGHLRHRLATACVPLLQRNLPAALRGELTFTPQDHAAATYCRKLDKADGALDFHRSASVLARRVNGLDPWPGACTEHDGTRLKVRGAQVAETHLPPPGGEVPRPGTVLDVHAEGADIATGEGTLRLCHWQKPGGKSLPAREFAHGYPLHPGTCLTSLPMTELLTSG